jgi:cyclic 2,3-diphosphoglycerate synthetase
VKVLVLVDGEHYPPVTRWGIEVARTKGFEVVAALFIGGIEKLPAGGEPPDLGTPVVPVAGELSVALARAIDELGPDGVLDLSDEPILGYRERKEQAAVALARGVA